MSDLKNTGVFVYGKNKNLLGMNRMYVVKELSISSIIYSASDYKI
jgi:hypothetical protein